MRIHGLAIVLRMYDLLLRDPNIRTIFDLTHQRDGTQPRALAQAVIAYAENIDNLAALGPAIERIASRHAALNIQPHHYDAFAIALLQGVRDILGDAATPEIVAAWTEAIGLLKTIFTTHEEEIYKARATAPGGWRGYRRFKFELIVPESSRISSFYLVPADGQPLPAFQPGQYLTLKLDVPGYGPLLRHYSLSSGAVQSNFYRISVKREDAPEEGIMPGLSSSYLHTIDTPGLLIDVAPPAGVFTLPDGERPLVLIAGGVGITPLLSMLERIAATQPNRIVHFIHAVRSHAHHAFGREVRDFIGRLPQGQAHIFYEKIGPEAKLGTDYHHIGRADPAWIAQNSKASEALYLVCGPRGFMRATIQGLLAQGIAPDRILYEFFGATDEDLLTIPALAA
ncbi:hypothetical protein VZ95_08670 [Elstera litoralis]|uniref:nitric oxide dioxygenase n=1 Tax=Elstera litoralis TaxID=552518 RepID=A0A0F3IT40_9PROT|nr:globin domain-containing protein [Elstera litoralis]KJV09876.1 hypothetical protein VZ95_08670 [Elstera litoralis]